MADKPNIARVLKFLDYFNNTQNNHPKDHIRRLQYNFGSLYKKLQTFFIETKKMKSHLHIRRLLTDEDDEEEYEKISDRRPD